MIYFLISIIIVLIIILCKVVKDSSYLYKQNVEEATGIKKEILDLKNEKQQLEDNNTILLNDKTKLQAQSSALKYNIEEQNKILKEMSESASQAFDTQKALMDDAFNNYVLVLESQYEEQDAEYKELLNNLKEAYASQQIVLLDEYNKTKEDLDKIKASRDAAVEAAVREQQIKEQLAFYCLPLSAVDAADIQILNSIKPKIAKPRILSMLIWSTYFQKPMTALCNNVLGTAVVTGIYKVTNQKNNMCYIGQAKNVADRWKEHAKCGLEIDTPANNKLYKAMIEDGIQNFSWELLEACDKEDLDDKERFYIELYDSKNFGYNTTAGNKRNGD